MLEPFRIRLDDAFARFDSTPKVRQIQQELDRAVRLLCVYSANRIAGSPIDYERTRTYLSRSLDRAKEDWVIRLRNVSYSYDYLQETLANPFIENLPGEDRRRLHDKPRLELSENLFCDLHKILTVGVDLGTDLPGHYREGPKVLKTQLRGKRQFMLSSLPKHREDVRLLMRALCSWANSQALLTLPGVFRAGLVHYYAALIHPFHVSTEPSHALLKVQYCITQATVKFLT